jgi:general secretion pathway protein A
MDYQSFRRSLRSDPLREWRAVIVSAALALIVLGGVAVLIHAQARQHALREAERSAAVVAQSAAREQERLLDAGQQVVLALTKRPEILGAAAEPCAALATGIVSGMPGYIDVVAVRPAGDVFCSARGTPRLPAGMTADDVKRVLESGSTTLGQYGVDKASGRATIAVAAPAVDDTGTVRAIVIAAIDVGELLRIAMESPLPPGTTMMIVDRGGVVLAHHPEPEHWIGEIVDESVRTTLLAEPGAGAIEAAAFDGTPSVLVAEPLLRYAGRASDATIVIAMPQRSVFRDADRLFGVQLAGLGLLTLAACVIGGLLMDRLITRPVHGMLRVITSLNRGDVRARVRQSDARRRDVLGHVARGLQTLGRRIEEQHAAARSLEEQLKLERAAALLAAMPAPDSPAPVSPSQADAPSATARPGAKPAYRDLAEPAFENVPNPRFLWLAPGHADALVRLTYALSQRRGCAILTGEPGCGKTLLIRSVVQRLEPNRYEIALLTNPGGGRVELLRQVLYELGIETAETGRAELVHTLHELVVQNFNRGRETLVIIDDAQQADDPEWYEEVSALLTVQTNERTLVTVLLAGTPELTAKIQRVKQLDRRVSIRCHLTALDEDQTYEYIRHRLRVAGADEGKFTRGAVKLIHAATQGVPQAINDLCDSALLLARTYELPGVDEEAMRRVLSEAPMAPDPTRPRPRNA